MSASDPEKKRTKRLPEKPRMAACACADLSFDAIVERVLASKKNWRVTCRELGVGVTCTACIPDLHAVLKERQAHAKKREKK
jgi:bacterioferritin-associated ferredoxin